MRKVVCFLRVSTTQQDLEQQREKVVAAILGDGYKKSEIVFVEGKESAIKNDEEHRVTLNQLKEEIARHPIEAVYVFAIDRLARKVSIVLSIKDYLTERKINLTFLNPHRMSTLTKNDEGEIVVDELTSMMLMFLSYGAEMEMKIRNARFEAAKSLMKTQGKITNGKPLYGYSIGVDKKPVKDDVQAGVVRDVFELVCAGNGCYATFKKLLGEGRVKPQKTYNGGVSFVRKMVLNLEYSGRGSMYPAIMDAETQDRAIEVMKAGKTQPKSVTKHVWLCKNLIWWDMKGRMCGRSRLNIYRWDENRGLEGNKSHCIKSDVVDGVAWLFAKYYWILFNARDNKERMQDVEKKIVENDASIKRLTGLVEDCKKRLDRAFSRYVLGDVPDSTYEATVGQIKWLIDDYSKQIAALETENTVLVKSRDNVSVNINDTFDTLDALSIEKKVDIVKKVIRSINVTKDGSTYTIDITSNMGDNEKFYYIGNGGVRKVWSIGSTGDVIPLQV